ncbi:MAG: Flp pilus assembly protein CpaB [Bryobacteraceae bacterium]
MKRNLVPLLGIAFVVAIASTGIFYGLFVSKIHGSSAPQKSIVVAARPIKKGTVLTPGDLKTSPWAGASLPKDTYGNLDSAAGSTVLEDIADGEPVLRERLASKDGASGGAGIPSGMRAVSVHITDSTGVLGLIRPGSKVDVQVVSPRGTPETEARTVLENVPVVSVGAPEPGSQGGMVIPVVTLLVRPVDGDVLAVADSAARVRLALRNPLDDGTRRAAGLSLASVFRGATAGGGRVEPAIARGAAAVVSGPRIVPVAATRPRPGERLIRRNDEHRDDNISLWIQVVGVEPGGLEEINSQVVSPSRPDLLQVAAFRAGTNGAASIKSLENRHLIDVVSTVRLTAGLNRPVSVQAGSRPNGTAAAAKPLENGSDCGIRIRFQPFQTADGRLRVRVSPEVTAPDGPRISVRKAETEADLADGQSFVISGLIGSKDRAAVLSSLFAGSDSPGMELLVMVTPRIAAPVRTAGLRP